MKGKELLGKGWSKVVEIHQADVAKGEARREREAERKSSRAQSKSEKQKAKNDKLKAKEAEKYGDLDAVLSEEEREKILSEEVRRFMGWGSPWKIEGKGKTWAQLVDPAGDPIGTGGTVMAVATLGLSLATHKGRRGRQNDKTLYIEVHPNGMIERSGSLLYGGKDYSHVPKKASGLEIQTETNRAPE